MNMPVPSMEMNLSLLHIIRRKVYVCVPANIVSYLTYNILQMATCPRLVCTGRKTCNSWFSYFTRKDGKDIGPPPVPLTDEELDDQERLPRDYDKELHDSLFTTNICECLAFVVANLPGRDPLRIAVTYLYKPRRLETPYFIDAWEDRDDDEARELTLVHLEKHAKNLKKCAVWRPSPRLEDWEERGYNTPPTTIRWCSTPAKSGMFADTSQYDSDGEDSADGGDASDDDDNDG